jgi:hypothetical protein
VGSAPLLLLQRIPPSQGRSSTMLLYRTGAWCARNPPVAVGQFCALFPEMNVALKTCSDSSIPLLQDIQQELLARPIASSPECVRLRLLRQHDTVRPWSSVRDMRVCMLCGSEFEGAQIRISVRAGKPVFSCPEPQCRGSLPHFAAAGNPLLDENAWSDWMRPPSELVQTAVESELC